MVLRKIKLKLLPILIFPLTFSMGGLFFVGSASANATCSLNWHQNMSIAANFSQPGKTAIELAEEEAEEKRIAFARSEAERRKNAWPTEFVKITKNMKNPNSVKIPFDQAPSISAKTRELNGRRVCAGSLKTGKKSKQDKDVHIDKECCLDEDEVPNPRCYYPQLGANNSPERIVSPNGEKIIK